MTRYFHTFTILQGDKRVTKHFDTTNPNVPQVTRLLERVYGRKGFEYESVTTYTEQP